MAQLDLLTANDRQGEYPASWYAATVAIPDARPSLEGDHRFDVCVIGGGLTGLSAALHLAKSGKKVCVLDAHRIAWGATGRNGGQINSGQRQGQDFLEKSYGLEKAKQLWELAEASKTLVRQLITEHDIDCKPVDGILTALHKKRYLDHAKREIDHYLDTYDYDRLTFVDKDDLKTHINSPAYHGGVMDTGALHLHPLAFAFGLAQAAERYGAVLFENTKVIGIETSSRPRILTGNGSVTADFVVIACNGYLGGLEPKVSARVMPINNFVIVTEPLSDTLRALTLPTSAAVADSKFVVNYFRMTHDNRLLFGGGENYGYRFPANIKEFVRKPMRHIFPQLGEMKIDYGWGGTLAITMKRLPYFARIAPNIYNCSGYSGHGVAMGTFAGKLTADAINGQADEFDVMASLGISAFPGGASLRFPLLVLAMTWYALRDRL